jgi:hypothetical protein
MSAVLPATRLPLVLLLGAGLLGCAEPTLPDGPSAEEAEQPLETRMPDPAGDQLMAQLALLRGTVASAHDHLEEAADAEDAATRTRAAEAAVAQLVDAPELGVVGAEPAEHPVLFPTTTDERGETGDGEDALTATLMLAREASGPLGQAVLGMLRDPVAGDIGSWQRDPAGMVEWTRSQAAVTGDLATREAAVLELPGEGTRALAWATMAAGTGSGDEASAYAQRGAAHLAVVLIAIDEITDRFGPQDAGETVGDGGGTADDAEGTAEDDGTPGDDT